ncbi:MAG: AEC family transporter [Ruminococcus sp.]|nr:AEC family transporter [Ruminococcus sp.]
MLSSFFDVGQQVLVLFILIGVGALLTKLGFITDKGASTMTDVVLYAVTPCVIVNAFQREYRPELLGGLLTALLCAFLTMLGSVLLAELIYRKTEISRAVVLKFSLVFSNCGFMALPLQEAVLGKDGVFYGAAYIAVFNIFMWTYGLITMSRKTELKSALKAIVNPGVIGTIIGVLLFVFSVKLPTVLASPVSLLAALNTPVPMLVIGYHLMHADLKRVLKDKGAYFAMAMRLILIPLAVLSILYLLQVDSTVAVAVVIAVSSPVAAFTTMMAAKYGRDTELSAGIVSASALFSLITMPLIVGLAMYLI